MPPHRSWRAEGRDKPPQKRQALRIAAWRPPSAPYSPAPAPGALHCAHSPPERSYAVSVRPNGAYRTTLLPSHPRRHRSPASAISPPVSQAHGPLDGPFSPFTPEDAVPLVPSVSCGTGIAEAPRGTPPGGVRSPRGGGNRTFPKSPALSRLAPAPLFTQGTPFPYPAWLRPSPAR